MMLLKKWLAHPLTRGMDLDDPRTTELRRRIILKKPSLKRIYQDWYSLIAGALPEGMEPVLELGSGAGFLSEYIPGLITSEVFPAAGVDAVLDGRLLPFPVGSLRAIVMTDVLHHIPNVRLFFAESARCIRKGGAILMVEPWVSAWSTLTYQRLHHEPFRPEAETWEFPSNGPLSGANGALPWIVFERDRARFEAEFPEWRIGRVDGMLPFSYLLTGGVSLRSLAPGFVFAAARWVEQRLVRWNRHFASFAFLELRRV